MLDDPRNTHVDSSTFHLFDPFRTINNSSSSRHLLDKAKRQTPDDRHDEEVEFELQHLQTGKDEDDESGIHSPPLWKNNNNSPIVYPLSPNSRRREAIVKGQKELMEMVRNLPESCYELSLKDMVEHNPRANQTQNQQEYDDDGKVQSNRYGGSKKFDKKRGYGVERQGSNNNNNNNNKGMLLKMVFPVGNRSSTRKSMVLLNSSSSKRSNSGGNSSNKYWWKSDSSHSRSSSSSNSNGNSNSTRSTSARERRTILPNCMACFQSSKIQGAE